MNKRLNPELICDKCRGNHHDKNGFKWDAAAFCYLEDSAAYKAWRGPPGLKKIKRTKHRAMIKAGKAAKGSRPWKTTGKKRKAKVLQEIAEESDKEIVAPEDDGAGEVPSTKGTKRK